VKLLTQPLSSPHILEAVPFFPLNSVGTAPGRMFIGVVGGFSFSFLVLLNLASSKVPPLPRCRSPFFLVVKQAYVFFGFVCGCVPFILLVFFRCSFFDLLPPGIVYFDPFGAR